MPASALIERPVIADNDPLNKVDPLGLRPSDLQMQHCNTNAMGQCPVVVNDVSNSFRAGTDEYVVPGRGLDCFVATDSAAHVAEASLAVGIDTRLVFGVYLQETTSCRRPGVDRIANTLGQLGSVGPSNLPASSFAATVYRNPQRFGFASASDVSTGWLMDRFQEMAHRGGIGDYNAAYATASRLKDIVDDLGEARRQRGVRLITRSQAQSLSQDPNFRVYRESALVGQAYTSVRNNSLSFFIDLFTYGDVGRIDENGIDALGESGYSNGFDATCSTFPFRR